MLTVSESEDDLLKALESGARGYVLRGTPAHGIAHAVRALAAGDVYISPALASTILYELTHRDEIDPFDALTQRESEVLQLVGEVLQKLQVRSRVEAALLAHRLEKHESRGPDSG